MSKFIVPIVIEPSYLLHKISKKNNKINKKIKLFILILKQTMIFHEGIGLASIQVGVPTRIIVVNFIQDNVLINPEFVSVSYDNIIYNEGCLSFEYIYNLIIRKNYIKIKYFNIKSKKVFLEISNNINSSCVQHEVDHINGILFIYRKKLLK